MSEDALVIVFIDINLVVCDFAHSSEIVRGLCIGCRP